MDRSQFTASDQSYGDVDSILRNDRKIGSVARGALKISWESWSAYNQNVQEMNENTSSISLSYFTLRIQYQRMIITSFNNLILFKDKESTSPKCMSPAIAALKNIIRLRIRSCYNLSPPPHPFWPMRSYLQFLSVPTPVSKSQSVLNIYFDLLGVIDKTNTL